MNKQLTVKGETPANNPFARAVAEHANVGTIEIESARAIAQAQGMLVIAKKFPRDEQEAYRRMMDSCARVSFAEQAMYKYPKGSAEVTGPSIRMAEELARNWGNLEFGVRELSRKDGVSEMEAFAWDLQTNVRRSIHFTVRHVVDTKNGPKAAKDERDIYELTANMGARRVRACILAILPPDYVDDSVAACAGTLKGGTVSADKVEAVVKSFLRYGVTLADIEARYGCQLNKISPEQYADLQGVYVALRDGHGAVETYFASAAQPAATAENNPAKKLNAKNAGSGRSSGSKNEQAPENSSTQSGVAAAESMPNVNETSEEESIIPD